MPEPMVLQTRVVVVVVAALETHLQELVMVVQELW
tara:strand:- start:214 stop:318 length:105 start_codon:yes stop_codon:yes gene_type:complete